MTTDQDLLRRIAEDKRTLRQLARQARADGDKAAGPPPSREHHAHHLATLGRTLQGRGSHADGLDRPLALVGTWCFYRMEYHPPRAGEPIEFSLITPAIEIDSIVHLVPQPGVRNPSSWAQQVMADGDPSRPPRGVARWQLTIADSPQAYELNIRIGPKTLVHPILVGQTRYLPPDMDHKAYSTHVSLRPVRLFDRLPGIPALALPAWTVAYLLLAIAGTLLFKRAFGIY